MSAFLRARGQLLSDSTIYSFSDFVDFLKFELRARIAKVRDYNRSKFAADLGLSHNRMSEILNRKLGLSTESARKIAKALALNEEETSYFCDLVDCRHARTIEARRLAKERIQSTNRYQELGLAEVQATGTWMSFAIIEALKVKGLNKPDRLADALRIDIRVVEAILGMLEKAGLAKCINGVWEGRPVRFGLKPGLSSEVLRDYHEGFFARVDKALAAPLIPKDFQLTFLALSKDQVTELRSRIALFVRQLATEQEHAADASAIYAFSAQLFSLNANHGP